MLGERRLKLKIRKAVPQKMSSAWSSFVALICTSVMLKPVHMSPGGPPPNRCPIPRSGLSISILEEPPFTEFKSGEVEGILGKFFTEISKKCFLNAQECKSVLKNDTIKKRLFNSTTSFKLAIDRNTTDIAFPITAPLTMELSGDRYSGPGLIFKEFIKSTGYSLIMDVKNFNQRSNDIVFHTLLVNTWPIFVFTLLIAGISGIFVWMLETYFNEEEFPRSFTKGCYEGFWWAFVSMTTVGYGDKTPKFVLGRLFGVLWILIGLVVIAVFTATATSALSISFSDLARLEGNKIGALNYTSARIEAMMKGAEVTGFTSVDSMFEALEKNEIDGILMDKYKVGYYLEKRNNERFKMFDAFDADIPYYVAIRDSDPIKEMTNEGACFKRRIEGNAVNELLISYLQPVTVYNSDSDSMSAFSGKSRSTHVFLFIILGVFLGLVFLGILAEVFYLKLWKSKKKVDSGEDGIEFKEMGVQPTFKAYLKGVEDKLEQLAREVGKLQEQFTVISSQANRCAGSENNTTHM